MSAVRLVITSDNSDGRPDISWLNLWSFVECATAVIVCNLAIFKFLFRGSNSNSNGNRANQRGADVQRYEANDQAAERGRGGVTKRVDWTVTRESKSPDTFLKSSSSSTVEMEQV
jgi:hypothetical protein